MFVNLIRFLKTAQRDLLRDSLTSRVISFPQGQEERTILLLSEGWQGKADCRARNNK